MASWLNRVLFGRQLSHGSDNENPQTFEEALPPVGNVEDLQQTVRASILSTCMHTCTVVDERDGALAKERAHPQGKKNRKLKR